MPDVIMSCFSACVFLIASWIGIRCLDKRGRPGPSYHQEVGTAVGSLKCVILYINMQTDS